MPHHVSNLVAHDRRIQHAKKIYVLLASENAGPHPLPGEVLLERGEVLRVALDRDARQREVREEREGGVHLLGGRACLRTR